jgi:hypothetical protein
VVRRSSPDTLADREDALLATQRDLMTEVGKLRREEEYLDLKVRQAREQVRYYEDLLNLLRRDFGKNPGLPDLVRRLG